MCGGCGVGSCGVSELQCVGVLVCGSFGVWDLQSVGVEGS